MFVYTRIYFMIRGVAYTNIRSMHLWLVRIIPNEYRKLCFHTGVLYRWHKSVWWHRDETRIVLIGRDTNISRKRENYINSYHPNYVVHWVTIQFNLPIPNRFFFAAFACPLTSKPSITVFLLWSFLFSHNSCFLFPPCTNRIIDRKIFGNMLTQRSFYA